MFFYDCHASCVNLYIRRKHINRSSKCKSPFPITVGSCFPVGANGPAQELVGSGPSWLGNVEKKYKYPATHTSHPTTRNFTVSERDSVFIWLFSFTVLQLVAPDGLFFEPWEAPRKAPSSKRTLNPKPGTLNP